MKKSFYRVLIFIFILVNIFASSQNIAFAESVGNIVDDIYISKSNGTIPVGNTYNVSDTLHVNINWSIPNNTVHAGDTSTITLPTELELITNLSFTMEDASHNVVANVSVNKTTNLITFTFTDYAQTHSDISGTMFFDCMFDYIDITSSRDYTLVFEDNMGVTYDDTVHIINNGVDPDEGIQKYATFDSNDPTLIHWIARVNIAQRTVPNAIIIDTIGSGHELVSGTIVINKVIPHFTATNLWYTDLGDVTNTLSIDTQSKGFTIDFNGSITNAYTVKYDTRITDGGTLANYVNNIKLTGSDSSIWSFNNTARYTSGGGHGNGTTGSINIFKYDSKTNGPLQNAQFSLIRVSNNQVVANVTTDSTGHATINNLTFDNYKLVETMAPLGYKSNAIPINVQITFATAIPINVANEMILGKVKLSKVDANNNNRLVGAEFTLKKADGTVIHQKLTTDTNGEINLNDLVPGSYQFIETKAPNGYQLSNNIYNFEISLGQINPVEVVVKNYKIETKPSKEETFIKIPSNKVLKENDIITYTFAGFKNPYAGYLQNYQIIDIPPVGLEFISGNVPAFYNGNGLTYNITYKTSDGKNGIINSNVDAGKPYYFSAPKTSSHISEITLTFNEVPVNFGKENTISYKFKVVKSNHHILVNEGILRFTKNGQTSEIRNQNDSTVHVYVDTSDNTSVTNLTINSLLSLLLIVLLKKEII